MTRFRLIRAAALLLGSVAFPAHAETLQDALAAAYRDNPTLNAARAGQRANDENVPLQRSAGLPQMRLEATAQDMAHQLPRVYATPRHTLSASATATLPIYSGGTVRNNVRAAKTRVQAGQLDLRATELAVFTDVVAAYMDVIRDSAVVALNEQNVKALSVNLQASSDRFEVGDLTRTDVAQSQSRYSLARGQLEQSRASLIASRERYIQLVGHAPDDLAPPPPLPGLPDSPETAVTVAIDNNPNLLASRKVREARKYDVRAARGARLPQLSLFSTGSYYDTLDSNLVAGVSDYSKQVVAGARITIPIYQGGGPSARVRQTQALESQDIEREIETERAVLAQTRAYYASWKASVDVIESSRVATDASKLSLEGVRAENSVGTRTILDILNAEQEALQAQVQLVTARRDAYVAGFTLLTLMGQITATNLGIDGGALYDPQVNYKRVSGKWFDWDDDPRPKAKSSRTVSSPVQGAQVMPGTTTP